MSSDGELVRRRYGDARLDEFRSNVVQLSRHVGALNAFDDELLDQVPLNDDDRVLAWREQDRSLAHYHGNFFVSAYRPRAATSQEAEKQSAHRAQDDEWGREPPG